MSGMQRRMGEEGRKEGEEEEERKEGGSSGWRCGILTVVTFRFSLNAVLLLQVCVVALCYCRYLNLYGPPLRKVYFNIILSRPTLTPYQARSIL